MSATTSGKVLRPATRLPEGGVLGDQLAGEAHQLLGHQGDAWLGLLAALREGCRRHGQRFSRQQRSRVAVTSWAFSSASLP